MNSTEERDRIKASGAVLFDEMIVPCAEVRKAKGLSPYFALAKDPGATSYFVEPAARVMQPADFEFPGGGTAEGLVDALAAHWTAQGEPDLAALAPGLKEVAAALKEEAAGGDGSVSILCYTMF